MSNILHPPSSNFTRTAHLNKIQYDEMYSQSIREPEKFWSEQGDRLDWIKRFTKVKNVSYSHPNVSIKWYEDGILNVSANCIDRHLAMRGNIQQLFGKVIILQMRNILVTLNCMKKLAD